MDITHIEHEEEVWGRIFKAELEKEKFTEFSHFWWKNYYSDITNFILILLKEDVSPNILEAGSGSGKSSILVAKHKGSLTLLDISKNALDYARYLSKNFGVSNVKYVHGNIFEMPFDSKTFDLTWNIGTLEHYGEKEILQGIGEMVRVTKNGGKVAFGIPNFYSGPTIKAWLLSKKLFHFIPGYRLDTETFLPSSRWSELVLRAGSEEWKCTNLQVSYFGHFLPMETPKFILQSTIWLDRILRRNRFLILISFTVERPLGQ